MGGGGQASEPEHRLQPSRVPSSVRPDHALPAAHSRDAGPAQTHPEVANAPTEQAKGSPSAFSSPARTGG